ncbi:alpha/beta fold hydrolase [Devosia sp. YIM 151766]|uniref:alpha/beta fold hydrolase n=1 Tax=Devosia sp. YIM 151766 TaxID=3017325 RepID=UPI00255C29F9|nr:alpha/beta fold hydrolase [Devosia sp. YIM 151766]WIY53259.1 alpha/beta fold hydrolase [Devosia sp. YIM 151766]
MNKVVPGPVETQDLAEAPLPLLLLAGTACDARLFEPMVKLLDVRPVQVVEMTSAETSAEMAGRILAEAPARFSLLGFSLGGIVALEMMAQAPERIARLALVNTTPRPDPKGNSRSRRATVAKARQEGMDSYVLDAWPELVTPANQNNAELKALIVDMARRAGDDVLASQAEIAIHRADSRPRLADIAVPTLVLAGEDERICPLDAHREIADAVPGARFFTISRAGHFAPLENPAAVARHVREWLDWTDPNPNSG